MTFAVSIFAPFEWVADQLTTWCGLDPSAGAGAAIAFFIYELGKVSVLILAISWCMALVRRSLPVERMRAWLGTPTGRLLGYPASAAFGSVTPFCSCSSVPLFIGFIEARLPVGIALAFLITSPLVNEIVVALFLASFGWQVALVYVLAGISLGVTGGWVLQRMHAERWLTDFAQRKTRAVAAQPMVFHDSAPTVSAKHSAAVSSTCCSGGTTTTVATAVAEKPCGCCQSSADTSSTNEPNGDDSKPPADSAFRFANHEARDIYVGVLPYLAIALVIGAGIHGFVPEHAFATWFATGRWWDVPAAVVLGFPLYASASATVPILETLVAKGVPLGTGMAFIMSAVGVSVPELVILKRVMTGRLLAAFSLTVGLGVVLVGTLFNFLF